MTDVLTDVLWVEKYRPQTLADVALEPDTRAVLQSYIDAGEIPHMLLVGPPGSGKTTVARILMAAVDCQVLGLNASAERGIDMVRDRIGNFVRSMLAKRWNIVFLDEADMLTTEAQTSLRNTIENFADRSRFIFTANAGHKIIPAIKSRCQEFTLGAPPLKERWRILSAVLAGEGIAADPQVILSYAERYPDMRRMLMATQKAYLANAGTLPAARDVTTAGGGELFALIQSKNWTKLKETSVRGDFDHQQALRDLFWSIPNNHPKIGPLLHVLGRAVNEGYVPDPIVQFLGVCAEAMEVL